MVVSGYTAVIPSAATGRTLGNPSFLAQLVTYLPERPVHGSVLATLLQSQPAPARGWLCQRAPSIPEAGPC